MTEAILELVDVRKSYGVGDAATEILYGITLTIRRGEFTALVGPSGSGKSTLLNLLGLLDRPTSGRLSVGGVDVSRLNDAGLTRLRGQTLGFVFQFHHLLPGLTLEENVMLPLAVSAGGTSVRTRMRARELLGAVGLGHRSNALPSRVSGGQQQRAAIARALAHAPPLVLADEPTGNLDTTTAASAFDLMRHVHREHGTAFLIVTHDPGLAERCDRVVTLVDGRVATDRSTGQLREGA